MVLHCEIPSNIALTSFNQKVVYSSFNSAVCVCTQLGFVKKNLEDGMLESDRKLCVWSKLCLFSLVREVWSALCEVQKEYQPK